MQSQHHGTKRSPAAGKTGTGRRGGSPASVPHERAEIAEIAELIEISTAVGGDPDLVQGGGGNTSVKSRDARFLYVKASGTALAEMDPSGGWARMDLAAVRGLLGREGIGSLDPADRESEVLRILQDAVLEPKGARPSVESSLHAILDRVVIHVHPVHLNAFLCSRDSREKYEELFKDLQVDLLYVPYVDPGYTLAARLDREIAEYRTQHGRLPSVVLLENHGVFVAASEVRQCIDLTRRVTDLGKAWAGTDRINGREDPLLVSCAAGGGGRAGNGLAGDGQAGASGIEEIRGALIGGGCRHGLLRRDDASIAAEFLSRSDNVILARQGAFTPDQIVYARTYPLVLDKDDAAGWRAAVAAYRERHGLDPRVILRPGAGGGVYYAAPDLKQIRVVAEVYRAAMVSVLRNDRGGGPRFLDRAQAGFIEGWEVEHYRAALSAGGERRLAGRIAAVTGGGSGLGKGIAAGLVEAGATVFALDINADALESVRRELPEARYVPVVTDVTSEESVTACFRAIAASAGGLDFLVNAAGIAPAHALVDFPLAAWKKALDINLTGYFLCAREAARILLRQGVGGSIVNLTSKSGFDASKDNSAYNATKAGEIHLMRGWALELGRAGVRVNCVAPGNVFKGSQIWNPEYIKAAAKKKGIRPEEVIPYYTSLTALGLEIEPEDIANAVIFLVSDEARRITGQTLVVDGGQVMVR